MVVDYAFVGGRTWRIRSSDIACRVVPGKFSAPVLRDGPVWRGTGDERFREDGDGEKATANPALGFVRDSFNSVA